MIKFNRMKYQFLEDIAIADIAFEAYGKTLKELFQNCALALTTVMVDLNDIKPSKNYKLRMKSQGIEELLFDFLSELVLLKDKDQILFSRFELKIEELKTKEYLLKANLRGEKINPQKHKLRSDVKAVTWHMFKLGKDDTGWKVQIILDI